MRLNRLLLATLSIVCIACSGPAQQTDGTTEPGNESGEENPDDSVNVDPNASSSTPEKQEDARKASASTKPMGGEATKTGADPQESKLTEQDEFDINAILKANKDPLLACYDNALEDKQIPVDGFLVKAGFTIEKDGTVKGAKVVESTSSIPEAEECFLTQLVSIKFPPPPEGRVIETTYPFTIRRTLRN